VGQTTVSTGHPFKHEFKGRDEGGDFYTTKVYMGEPGVEQTPAHQIYSLDTTHVAGRTTDKYYVGPLFPGTASSSYARLFPPDDSSDWGVLVGKGTTAIARCKPGQPVADLSTSLAELVREGIPSMIGASLWKSKAGIVRNAGSEYLNSIFGWAPLVSDIQDTARAIIHYEGLLAQYERDAGKLVRRGYTFDDEETRSSSVQTGVHPWGTYSVGYEKVDAGMTRGGSFAGARLEVEKVMTKKTWFSGAFTYYLPDTYYSREKWRSAAAKAKVLLGVELTPEVLWNLAPWSWFTDWFVNTGDVLSNVSQFATGELVMPFGYVMEHTITTHRYVMTGHDLKAAPGRLSWSFSRETKQRVKASPFGFGLTWSSFTPKQLAILASIGVTR